MQEFIKGIVTNPFFSILTGLTGGWGGFRLGISQDRRKEFNEAAEVLFEELRNKEFRPDFERFHRRLYWYKRFSFNRCVAEYHKATGPENETPPDNFGRRNYIDDTRIETARKNLMKFTNRL